MMVKPDKKDQIFIGIVVLVHVLYFLMACKFTRIYMGDSIEYINEALNIKKLFFFYSGDPSLPISPENMTQRQPIYPLFLLGVYCITVNNWIVLILQNVISICNIWYTRSILLRIGHRKEFDWLLLLLVVAYLAQFINANTIAPDILLQSFTLLYLGCFVQLIQTKQIKYSSLMSFALICGLFVKPVLYPFVVVHIIIIVAVAYAYKLKIRRPVAYAMLPLLAVLLYNYSNYERTGKFHFSSNQSFNAIYYYYPFLSQKEGQDSAIKFLARERASYDALPNYKDRYNYANKVGMNMMKENFLPYMAFHLKNTARIFIEPGKAELDLFTGHLTYEQLYSKEQTGFYATYKAKGMAGMGDYFRNNPSMIVVIIVLLFNVIRLIGLLLFFRNRSIYWPVRLFVFLFAGYFALAAGPIANTRYFLPVSLIVIGCSVIGYSTLLINRRNIRIA